MKLFNIRNLNRGNIFPIKLKGYVIISAVLTLSACAGAAPLVTAFVKTLGGNLISSAIQNYSPQYGQDIEDLLSAMAGKGRKNSQQEYNEESFDSQYQEEQEFEEFQEYQEYDGNEVQSNFTDTNQVEDSSQSNDAAYQETAYDEEYVDQQWQEAEIAMGVDVLVQRAGDTRNAKPAPIQDGETLYSNPSDPVQGDKIKVSFNANCDCYVYVVGIDSTGYVVQIFPDPQAGQTNPVQRDTSYLVPEGNDWYGLDEYTGTEEIYFITSKNRRLDLERIIQKLSAQERNVGKEYVAVQEAAVIPKVRGLVKITSPKTSFAQTTSGQSFAFSPTLFISNAKNADLAITRWFIHQ